MSKRDATADLATCDATGDTEWAYEFYSEALPYWLREVERLRGVAEANLTMAADLIAMEGTIKDLRFALANHAQFQRGIECQFCRLTFELGTPDDVLTQHAMTCEKSPVVQENARLHKIIADATGHSKDGDGVDLLCKALYGRPGQVPDWLGGSEARMLYDAAEEIEELRAEANALNRLRAWRAEIPSERTYMLNEEELCLGRFFLSEWEYPVAVDARAGTFAEMVEAALSQWSELYGEQQ